MFWKYLLFETKLLLLNKKNWLLGLALILFFPLYYSYYSKLDLVDIREEMDEEVDNLHKTYDKFPGSVWQTNEGKEIRANLIEQSSLINMKRYALWKDSDFHEFFDAGLKLNELRLENHQRGNKGIQKEYIIPVNEILKENALYRYHKEHELPFIQNPFEASNYIPVALPLISGVMFCLFVLLMGSSMLVNDQQHPSVVHGFPISFMQKAISKVGVHFVQVMLFLFVSIVIGGYYVSRKTGWGDFRTPVLIYQDADFFAVSMLHYLFLMFIAFGLIALLLLSAFLLINIVTKNLYATILILLFVLLSPQLLQVAGVETNWLYPLEILDVAAVLGGEAAKELSIEKLDFKHAFSWLVVLNLVVISILYGRNKLVKIRRVETVSIKSS
ncbi:hypothetical protein [Sporosarcina highlanderae]|uniref:ABC transporter permease n=1 Tax=Sporosarcina highlanderae TaxID=3035916 RepID=A0ABT8JSA9_9BACL|nr:hypothetical protein [Sporosarcina highlanderae]MDN4607995.1 hypothetical protein [Sporosarcina highlanderae]